MKLFKSVQTFDKFTGRPNEEKENIWTGEYICDYCGVELSADFDNENMPYVTYAVEDISGNMPYYHKDKLRYTRKEALDLFDIDWDANIEADNYEIFKTTNPFVYCRERGCFMSILKKAVGEGYDELYDYMMVARLEMLDRVFRQNSLTIRKLASCFNK